MNTETTGPLIADVSDTAFWIAHHRAIETARADALFRDPLAANLSGERGRTIASAMPMDRMVGWTVAIRTCIIDELIVAALGEGVDTIVNLGAGLDTRPYRMELPASLRWIEADYAHLVEYKDSSLAGELPRCHLERVKIDLADRQARRSLLSLVDANAGLALVLTEGVVPYLTNDEAGSLADDLRNMQHARYWIVDYFSPQMMKYRRSKGMERRMGNAPFRFEPADWFGFFREHGWRAREIQYMTDAAQRLGRPLPLPWYMKAMVSISRLLAPKERMDAMRKFAAYVLLEPA